MFKVFPPLLVSFFAVSAMATDNPPQGRCDEVDEIISTIYNDPYFSRPENKRKRDDLVQNIIRNETLCDQIRA